MAIEFWSVHLSADSTLGEGVRYLGRVEDGEIADDPGGWLERNLPDDPLADAEGVDPLDEDFLISRWSGPSVIAASVDGHGDRRTWYEGWSTERLQNEYDRLGRQPNTVNLRARGAINRELERRDSQRIS